MKTIIQTLDFKPRQSLLDFVEETLGKLASFNELIVDSKVILRINKSSERENKVCEIRIAIPGFDFFAAKSSETFEDATLKALDAIKHQLSRSKPSKLHDADQVLPRL